MDAPPFWGADKSETDFDLLRELIYKNNDMAATNSENRNRRYIRINDNSLWEMIDELSALDERYSKNFNQIVNDALYYGLPIVLSIAKGEVDLPDKVQDEINLVAGAPPDSMVNAEVIRLLKQLTVEILINNSMTASLFAAKSLELNGRSASGEKFEKGLYGDTPECWEEEEAVKLNEIKEVKNE